jgi:hypothetical protein
MIKHAGAPEEWLSIVHDAVDKWQLGHNMREMAQILTDPRSGPLSRKLIDLKADSSQAGAIAARMIMQARGVSGGSNSDNAPISIRTSGQYQPAQ